MKLFFVILVLAFPIITYGQSRSVSINKSNNTTKMTVKQENGNNFSLEYEGEIELTEDDSDVASISNGGYLEIKKSGFGSRRRVYIENDGGQLIKTYFVGSTETSFEPEGQKWLAEILLEVVRTTTLGAEGRFKKYYESGGASRVLNEIERLDNDHVKAHYLKLLLAKKLSNNDVEEFLLQVNEIESDHYKAEILSNNINSFLTSESSISAFMITVGNIDSDHHKAEILNRAIDLDNLSENNLRGLFGIIKDIDSDHHKAEIFKRLINQKSLSENNVGLLIQGMEDIDSDHHKAEILKELLRNPITAKMQDQVIRLTINNVDSDHHQSDILSTLINEQEITDSTVGNIIKAVSEINSSHHQSEIYRRLSDLELSDDSLVSALQAISEIDSDHFLLEILITLSPQVRKSSEKVKNAYIEAAGNFSSTHNRDSALKVIK